MTTLRRRGFDALFPIEEIGVAQGNCLSPLLGNVLLSEFDQIMSDDECRCLRYIDDFILLGPDKKTVRKRFRQITEYLRQYGMSAYDPRTESEKADHGDVARGFDFLGVNLKGGAIRPSKKSRRRLIGRIDELFGDSIRAMSQSDTQTLERKHSLVRTLTLADGIAKGWSEQYSYCNERNVFQTLDRQIDKKLRGYLGRYASIQSKTHSDDEKRHLLGVALLTDSESRPIKQDETIIARHAQSKEGQSP